jgi:hypothetical protein
MLPFKPSLGSPVPRFAEAVRQMLAALPELNPEQECYLMVDEGLVQPGRAHRRPGLHVDGYWHVPASCHGPSQPYHSPTPPRHRPTPGWSPAPRHSASGNRSEALLLASNYPAARAYTGAYRRDFEGDWRGGDCSELSLANLQRLDLQAGLCYRLDALASLHESLPILSTQPVRRTVVRINAPLA